MTLKIDRITIGARDVASARHFYERWFGCTLRPDSGSTLTFSLGTDSELAIRPWQEMAAEAGVPDAGSGFRAFTLSYIVDSADVVDELLEGARRAGGVVSKQPHNAIWGYSAYITDPGGCLWKVASTKRRPLVARRPSSPSATSRGTREHRPKEIPLTIAVEDMRRAKTFYADGLGLAVKKDYRKFVMFGGEHGTSDLGMYRREALAEDAAVEPAGQGFRGFCLEHLVDAPDQVDELLASATAAGARLVRSASRRNGHGYGAYFSDPDGNLWTVRARG